MFGARIRITMQIFVIRVQDASLISRRAVGKRSERWRRLGTGGGNAVSSHRTKDARDPFGTELLGTCLLACLVAFGHVIEHGKRFVPKHFTFQT